MTDELARDAHKQALIVREKAVELKEEMAVLRKELEQVRSLVEAALETSGVDFTPNMSLPQEDIEDAVRDIEKDFIKGFYRISGDS